LQVHTPIADDCAAFWTDALLEPITVVEFEPAVELSHQLMQ